MTELDKEIVENIRYSVDTVTTSELKNCDYKDAVNMNNELRHLLRIIDTLGAEREKPSLLERLLRNGYSINKSDEHTGKHESCYYSDGDESFGKMQGIGSSYVSDDTLSFPELEAFLTKQLEQANG